MDFTVLTRNPVCLLRFPVFDILSRFMIHPWAKLTTTFLNLDGAGAGGRPMLFRTTGLSPTEAFLKGQPKTGYSHANVISQDGFTRGLIKSGTDWQVYRDSKS